MVLDLSLVQVMPKNLRQSEKNQICSTHVLRFQEVPSYYLSCMNTHAPTQLDWFSTSETSNAATNVTEKTPLNTTQPCDEQVTPEAMMQQMAELNARLRAASDPGTDSHKESIGILHEKSMNKPHEIVRDGRMAVPIYRLIDTIKRAGKDVERRRFRVPFYDGGKRRFKTSKSLQKARDIARRIARAEGRALETAASTMSISDLGSYEKAIEICKPLGKSPVSIVEEHFELTQLIRSVIPEDPPSLRQIIDEYSEKQKRLRFITITTVDDVAIGYIKDLLGDLEEGKGEESTAKRERAEIRNFQRAFGIRFIHTIEPEEIEDYLHERKLKRTTRNQYLSAIRNLFIYAKDKRYLLRDMATAAERASWEKGRESRNGTPSVLLYTVDEVDRIIRTANANDEYRKWVPTLVIWFFCGIRFSEIYRLKWEHVDTHKMVIEADRSITKTRRDRTIYLCPAAVSWLELFQETDSPIMPILKDEQDVPLKKQNQEKKRTHFMSVFHAVLELAKIDFKPNGLRHAYASNIYVLTWNEEFVCDQMGNSKGVLFSHYRGKAKPLDAERYFCMTANRADPRSKLTTRDWVPSTAFLIPEDEARVKKLKKAA